MSCLLVAPMMKTVFLAFMPSISVISWFNTLSAAPPASPTLLPLWVAIESSSSKKRTHGADCLALSKISQILASLTKPHGKQLRFLHTDEVSLALISNCLGQQSLSTARRAVKQNTLWRIHSKLLEFIWMLHWILNSLQEFELVEKNDN